MGDLSELRGLVVVGTFISMLVLGISLMPSQLFTFEGSKAIEYPEYFEAMDLTNFNSTWDSFLDTGTNMGGDLWFQYPDDGTGTFGGWDIEVITSSTASLIQVNKMNYWWIFRIGSTIMTFSDERGIDLGTGLSGTELNSAYATYGKTEFKVSITGTLNFKIIFSFNTTTYNTPILAWNADKLYILCGIGFDQIQTTFNAWNIISGIIFFKLPNLQIPFLNIIIAVAIWIPVAYICYILILRAIGAWFGGGGS